MQLGKKLREYQRAKEMTQEQLSRLLRIDAGTTSRILAGKRGVSIKRLMRIARTIGLPPSELL